MDEKFRERLRSAKTPEEFINYIDEAEKAKYGEEKTEKFINVQAQS